MKTVLIIAYLMGGHVIDTEILDAASMEECRKTRQTALSGKTPVTTRYGSDVKISAECRPAPTAAETNFHNSAL
jgi:hypothetical protein